MIIYITIMKVLPCLLLQRYYKFLVIFQYSSWMLLLCSGFCPSATAFQKLLPGERQGHVVVVRNVPPRSSLLPTTTLMKIHSLPDNNVNTDSDHDNVNDNNETDDDEDDDNDEEDTIKPYGNRSLAWTKRYRRLNPYEKVRDRVIRQFGHRSKQDWDECIANGWQGQYVPSRPHEMYAPEWISWDDFLGIMRDYNDCRNVAVNVLGLQSLDEYIIFVRSNPRRAQGLRIPVRPDLLYKDQGWINEETFFSKKDNE